MLFVRTYRGPLGGHIKVFDYIGHVAKSELFEPVLYLTADSTVFPDDLLPPGVRIIDQPIEADAYFVAGLNWLVLDNAGLQTDGKPVVNLLQGLLHASPDDRRFEFLARPALRICVSEAVAQAVEATGRVHGPRCTIPNGIDARFLTSFARVERERGVFISGMKGPEVAKALAKELTATGVEVDLCCELLDRREFLQRMGSSAIAVCLPLPCEGFFLPPLEAMALGCVVVMPHCEGAQSYCIDGQTALVAEYAAAPLARAVQRVLGDPVLADRLRVGASAIVQEHSLERERSAFLEALRGYAGVHA